jgi:hypothetical protein
LRNVGIFIGKKVWLENSLSQKKEGDRVEVGPGTEQVVQGKTDMEATGGYVKEHLIGSYYFRAKPFPYGYSNISQTKSLYTYLPMKMGQSVPKRRHIKFRSRVITQKKA